jgi:hypothetical protein
MLKVLWLRQDRLDNKLLKLIGVLLSGQFDGDTRAGRRHQSGYSGVLHVTDIDHHCSDVVGLRAGTPVLGPAKHLRGEIDTKYHGAYLSRCPSWSSESLKTFTPTPVTGTKMWLFSLLTVTE